MEEKDCFKKNDVVYVESGEPRGVLGKIEEVFEEENKAVVNFLIPRHPKNKIKNILTHLPDIEICDECGYATLTVTGERGNYNYGDEEIVCFRCGCGHGHGFEEKKIIVSLDRLCNITARRKNKERAKIMMTLIRAKKSGFISEKGEEKILELLE